MIVSFSVSNFRSFSSEETFSLVASNRLSGLQDDHTAAIPDSDQRVLKVGVIYGANGAGKSNLFKALRYMRSVALSARGKNNGTGREGFRLSDMSAEPSTFDLQFIAADKLYRFGFKVNDDHISEEWLAQIKNGKERTLYERATDSDGKVTVDASGLKGASKKLTALATIGGPKNQSFLATASATLNTSDYGNELGTIIEWLKSSLELIGPNTQHGKLGPHFLNDPSCATFAGAFLKSASTGIDHLEVSKTEISEEELRGLLPESLVSEILKDIEDEEDGMALVKVSEGNELLIEKTAENHFYRIAIRSAHRDSKGEVVPFKLIDESDGTRRLLNLMPALHSLQTSTKSGVFFIDEIDRSLHPNLVWQFLDFFLKSCSDCRSQIIVTTHESNLLDLELLRRDEIWFAEKDSFSATRLYALTDFNVRKDLEIRKHYLTGRFGAIPFLGDLNRLHEQKSQTA